MNEKHVETASYSKLLEAILVYFRIKYDKLSNICYRIYCENGDYTMLEINTESSNVIFEGRVVDEDVLVEKLSKI